jgi:hypothetical protein
LPERKDNHKALGCQWQDLSSYVCISDQQKVESIQKGDWRLMDDRKDVPYIVYEGTVARNERTIKRLIIALVIAVILAFCSNIAWIYYESLYETMAYQQNGDGFNNVVTGEQGDVDYVANGEN